MPKTLFADKSTSKASAARHRWPRPEPGKRKARAKINTADANQTTIQAVCIERQRMAQDLHDELAGNLTLLAQRSTDPALAALSRQTLLNLRGLLAGYQQGGVNWTDWCADQRAQVAVACECAEVTLSWMPSGDATLLPRQAMHLQRMLREVVSNALKHSVCTTLCVQLDATATGLRVQVCDNGTGFDAAHFAMQQHQGHAMGLPGLQLRAQACGGQCQLHSTIGEGTAVEISLLF